MKTKETVANRKQDKNSTEMEVTETSETNENKEEKLEDSSKTDDTSKSPEASKTAELQQEKEQTPGEKKETQQQQEKSVHKGKINVTPQKDSKKPNKENSPGPKKQSGSKLPVLKTVEKQNASARRSLEDKLHRQISKLREPKNERVRTENNKPPSNPDRSRSPLERSQT